MTNFASQLRANLGVKDATIPKERASNAYSVADMALQYQPIVATDTGTLAGLEALVRWQDPVKGLLAAGEFIHGLNMSSFRSQLAPWVVGSACSISRAWLDQSLEPPPITVNFATFEVHELPVDRMLAKTLTDTGIAPDRVLIEIPGGALVPASIALRNKLRAIQDMDVQLVADISELDLDGLATALDIGVVGVTVDVPTVAAGAERRKRAQAVAARVRERGIVLTGKRADSIDEIETARELRCQRVLGYAFGAPLSETECAELLANVMLASPSARRATAAAPCGRRCCCERSARRGRLARARRSSSRRCSPTSASTEFSCELTPRSRSGTRSSCSCARTPPHPYSSWRPPWLALSASAPPTASTPGSRSPRPRACCSSPLGAPMRRSRTGTSILRPLAPRSPPRDRGLGALARSREPRRLGPGGVPEWLKGTVLKTVVRFGVPWVRIPPPPPARTLATSRRPCPRALPDAAPRSPCLG